MGQKCLPLWEVLELPFQEIHIHNSYTGFFLTNPLIRFLPSFLQPWKTINHHSLISIKIYFMPCLFSSWVDKKDVLLEIQPTVLQDNSRVGV